MRLVKLHYYGYEFQVINDWALHLVTISSRFKCQISLIIFIVAVIFWSRLIILMKLVVKCLEIDQMDTNLAAPFNESDSIKI